MLPSMDLLEQIGTFGGFNYTIIYDSFDRERFIRGIGFTVSLSLACMLVSIFGGSLFTETLLGINGIGRFMFEALQSRDYDVIMAMTVIVSTAFVLLNLAVEISYAFIDPRIRLGIESQS